MSHITFFCTQLTLPHGTTYAEIQAPSTDTTLPTEGRFLKKSRTCALFSSEASAFVLVSVCLSAMLLAYAIVGKSTT